MIGGARMAFLRAHAAPCVKPEPSRHFEHTQARAQVILFALRDDHDRRHDRRHVLAVARFLRGGFRGVVTGAQFVTYARGMATTRNDAIVLATVRDGVRAIRVTDAAEVRLVRGPKWNLRSICVARDGYVFATDYKTYDAHYRFCIRVFTPQLEFESTIAEARIDALPIAICANESAVIVSFQDYRADLVIFRRGDGTLLREITVPERDFARPIFCCRSTITGLTMLSDQRKFAAYTRIFTKLYVYIYGIDGELLRRVPTEHISPLIVGVCVAPSGEIAAIKDGYIHITDGTGAPLRHKLPSGCYHHIAATLQRGGFVISDPYGNGPYTNFVLQ